MIFCIMTGAYPSEDLDKEKKIFNDPEKRAESYYYKAFYAVANETLKDGSQFFATDERKSIKVGSVFLWMFITYEIKFRIEIIYTFLLCSD